MTGKQAERKNSKYAAVTIDTQVVVTNSFNFGGGLLDQLRSLKELPFDVVISDVVAREILRRLLTSTKENRQKLESAFKTATDFGVAGEVELHGLTGKEIGAIARDRMLEYFKDIGAEIIGSEGVSVQDIMKLYFAGAAPFSKGAKKSEFPDAVALLSLEVWAKQQSKKILAISGDKDWLEYGTISETIDVVPEISDALEVLNSQSEKARADAAVVLGKVAEDPNSILACQLFEQLSRALELIALDADAISHLEFESEIVDATLLAYQLHNKNLFQLIAVNADHTELVVKLDINLVFEAETTFYFTVHDSIDDDDVQIGEASAVAKDEATVGVIVSIAIDADGEAEITKAEIVDRYLSIYFGHVEPDFGDDEYFYDEPESPNGEKPSESSSPPF